MRFSVLAASATALLSGLSQARPAAADDFPHVLDAAVAASMFRPSEADADPANLLKRQSQNRGIQCPGPFSAAPTVGVQEAINHFRQRGGQPSLPAAPGRWPVCSESFCFRDGTSVSWCNEETWPMTLSSWNYIADALQVMMIAPRCTRSENGVIVTGGAFFFESPGRWYAFIGRC